MKVNTNIFSFNNFSPKEIIIYSRNNINLIFYYLMKTFDSINSSLNQSEIIINKIEKLNKSNSNNLTKDTSNSQSQNSIFEEKEKEILLESFKDMYKKNNIGKYNWKIRTMKILKYKIKQIFRKGKIPIVTKYYGRSKVALLKPRLHGRFIKKKLKNV